MKSACFAKFTVAALVIVMAGCATTSGTSAPGAKPGATKSRANATNAPEERAVERWNHLIEHKAELAWDYFTPGYKQIKKRDEYATEMNSRPVKWTKATFYTKKCEREDVCVLDLQIDMSVPMQGVGKNVPTLAFVRETWIRDGKRWWFLPDMGDSK